MEFLSVPRGGAGALPEVLNTENSGAQVTSGHREHRDTGNGTQVAGHRERDTGNGTLPADGVSITNLIT